MQAPLLPQTRPGLVGSLRALSTNFQANQFAIPCKYELGMIDQSQFGWGLGALYASGRMCQDEK